VPLAILYLTIEALVRKGKLITTQFGIKVGNQMIGLMLLKRLQMGVEA
jgi:hypothetical protein